LTRPEVVVGIKEEGKRGLAIPPCTAALLIKSLEGVRDLGKGGREGGREGERMYVCKWFASMY